MIRTKLAKKLLSSKEQQHLTASGINSIAAMERQIVFMRKANPTDPGSVCLECFWIAKKLGIEKS